MNAKQMKIMNSEEYEQKKRECWEECAAKVGIETTNLLCKAIAYLSFDRAYALGKEKETITQEEIEKAAEKYADEIKIPVSVPGVMVPFINGLAHDSYLQGAKDFLGKPKKDADTVIQGWVCRDNNSLNAQVLIGDKPKRTGYGYWENKSADCITLPKDLFPDLTWESDPIEVELIIKRKKK